MSKVSESVKVMRELVGYRAPSKRVLLTGKNRTKPIANVAGGAWGGSVGDSISSATKSFTSVVAEYEPLGTLIVWYSYETPIAVHAADHNKTILSIYNYSSTTNRHQSKILSQQLGSVMLAVDDHIADGMTYEDVLTNKTKHLMEYVEKFKRARSSELWVLNVEQAWDDLQKAVTMLDPDYKPSLVSPCTTDKLTAKMTAWRLHNPQVAAVAAKLEPLYK